MVESGEESANSSSVNSCKEFESPSPSSSSEECGNEDEPDTSSILRQSSSKRKKNDNQSQSTGEATEKQQQKKSKEQNDSSNNDEMEELTYWIFSTQEATQVDAEIGSPGVKVFSQREYFAKNMLSEEQRANFQLLIAGFCRTFSTLLSDCTQLPDKQNRKAAFSAGWIKLLSNFRSGTSSRINSQGARTIYLCTRLQY